MTQEEKELLIKDLSTRTPYKVKASYYGTDEEMECIDIVEGVIIDNNDAEIIIGQYGLSAEKVKPYLFPMSSMTKEQKEEFNSYFATVPYYGNNEHEHVVPCYFVELLIEFFHKNHIDNNGLIEKGLALDATGLNIY